jgi:hypothetical protein
LVNAGTLQLAMAAHRAIAGGAITNNATFVNHNNALTLAN